MNIRAIYRAFLGQQPNAENVLRRLASEANTTFDTYIKSLSDQFGNSLDISGSDPGYVPKQPCENVWTVYTKNSAEKILLYSIVQKVLGWERCMVSVKYGRQHTFHSLTMNDTLYLHELWNYYYEHWAKAFDAKYRTNIRYQSNKDAAAACRTSVETFTKILTGYTFEFIQTNDLVPDDVPTATKSKTYNTYTSGVDVPKLNRPADYDHRIDPNKRKQLNG